MHRKGYIKKYTEIEQRIADTFVKYVQNGLSPRDAVLTLDYVIFVQHNHEFHNLTEEQQSEIREILNSMKLVHV